MKTKSKTLLSKISQAGSMMIEAMAMLALISLVTPTLYKKSAERTSELQDINTAAHLRTIMKAADSYVSANYESLLEELADGNTKEINLEDGGTASGIHDYFPYGYEFNTIKNFEKPKITLKRQGMSITTFVELPKKTDIGDMRAARIASMVGSNGGYVDADGNAQGVGGVWGLDATGLGELGFNGGRGSVVVASSDAINSAMSGALENEKYLQRTQVESDDQLWRNTMVTDLYMGGVSGAADMYKILGVDQLILGSTDWETHDADLVLSNENGYEGSAWLAGTLSAMSDSFIVGGTVDNPLLALGQGSEDAAGNDGELLYVDADEASIYNGADGDGKVGLLLKPADATMETDYATEIRNTLGVTGDTTVASGDNTTMFKAGPDGSYITAEANRVALMDGNVEVSRGADGGASTTNIKTTTTNITGDTTIGATPETGRGGQIVLNPKLSVQGSAYVRDDLEVGNTLYAKNFNTLELHAGGTDFADKDRRWLHATADGVTVTNPDDITDPILDINRTETQLYGPEGSNGGNSPAVLLGYTDLRLQGDTDADLYTQDASGTVELQRGAITLTGQPGGESGNTVDVKADSVDIRADTTTVHDGVFQVTRETTNNAGSVSSEETFYVDPSNNMTMARVDTKGMFQVLGGENRGLLKVYESAPNGMDSKAVVEIDDQSLRVSTLHGISDGDSDSSSNTILYVDALNYDSKSEGERESSSDASVYIRRGAIEMEAPEKNSNYSADSGVGYITASRFVSNALDTSPVDVNYPNTPPDLAVPVYSDDYEKGVYYSGTRVAYDRYMVNPAYTSVMHDIKLTTRGGARLSDILPDFINKGIYVVNNTYKDEGGDLANIKVGVSSSGRLVDDTFTEVPSGTLSGENQWASPFMGVVPAPQCPPGYARVITITPAGFQMSQAGSITREQHFKGDNASDGKYRFVVDEHSTINKLGNVSKLDPNQTVTGAQLTTTTIDTDGTKIYYLGHSAEPTVTDEHGNPYSPQPLYFQQSTWLRSKVQPQGGANGEVCGVGGIECGDNFLGWSAIMGFVYPYVFYSDVIDRLEESDDVLIGDAENEGHEGSHDDGDIYWNIFPVRAQTLEAYATVYCYFDRTNLYDSGNDPKYVDQYDQLNNYRSSHSKEYGGTSNAGTVSGNNSTYIERLDDPALRYRDPW